MLLDFNTYNSDGAKIHGPLQTVGHMALEVVGMMERRGQANMPPHSLLPRPQEVGKKVSPVIL
jgi:hypothetical protein